MKGAKVTVNNNYTGKNQHLIGHTGKVISIEPNVQYSHMVYFEYRFQYEAFNENELDFKIEGK